MEYVLQLEDDLHLADGLQQEIDEQLEDNLYFKDHLRVEDNVVMERDVHVHIEEVLQMESAQINIYRIL